MNDENFIPKIGQRIWYHDKRIPGLWLQSMIVIGIYEGIVFGSFFESADIKNCELFETEEEAIEYLNKLEEKE